ncbi:uncharacterized protein METZ01_LOCUS89347, partial [marine metagenome]
METILGIAGLNAQSINGVVIQKLGNFLWNTGKQAQLAGINHGAQD